MRPLPFVEFPICAQRLDDNFNFVAIITASHCSRALLVTAVLRTNEPKMRAKVPSIRMSL
jgi:hypothetical protein